MAYAPTRYRRGRGRRGRPPSNCILAWSVRLRVTDAPLYMPLTRSFRRWPENNILLVSLWSATTDDTDSDKLCFPSWGRFWYVLHARACVCSGRIGPVGVLMCFSTPTPPSLLCLYGGVFATQVLALVLMAVLATVVRVGVK